MKLLKIVLITLIAFVWIGCGKETKNEDHDHPHETLQLTGYSETLELFAEATPFVVGEQSEILAHFTSLNDFKPLTGAKITASLIVGSEGIRQSLEDTDSPGIYKFHLTPVKAGLGNLVFDVSTGNGSSKITLQIEVFNNHESAMEAAVHSAVSSTNGIVFTKEQSWKVDFATEAVNNSPLGQIIKTTAQILPAQGDQQIVAAKSGGIVQMNGPQIVEGSPVAAGQSLFTLSSSGMAENNISVKYSEAEAEYKRAKAEYDRKKELADEKLITQTELLAAQTEFISAEAVYKNLKGNYPSGRQTVTSPIRGYITQVLVNNGEFVEAGQAVLAVSQNLDLLIKAKVQPKYYSLLNNISSANFVIPNSNLKYTLEELNGQVISYGKAVNPENPLIPVVFRVRNNVGFLPGSFIEVYLKTKSSENILSVPNDAIVEEMGSYCVFVQLNPEYFEKRIIRKGITDGIRTEIISGISSGERVVSKGAVLVKLAQSSGALDPHAGHVH